MSDVMEVATRKRKAGLGDAPLCPSKTLKRMLEGEPSLQRMILEEDIVTGHVVALSSRLQRDADRWEAEQMPSLSAFPVLHRLELVDSRYMTSLHPSVTGLKHLRELRLVGCSTLKSIPPMIDQLTQLEEVS
jgi:hypothetical protein